MNPNTKPYSILALLGCFLALLSPAQAQQAAKWHEFVPRWLPTEQRTHYADRPLVLKFSPCEGCAWDERVPNLPVKIIELHPPAGMSYAVAGTDGAASELEGEWFGYLGEDFQWPETAASVSPVRVDGGRRVQQLRINLMCQFFDANLRADTLRYALSLVPDDSKPGAAPAAKTAFRETSLLASGEWRRVAVRSEGVYRIDHALLRELGLDPGNIDPRRFGVFGRGGGMLPQENDAPAMDDMVENAIAFVGNENDGNWGADEYFVFYGQGPHMTLGSPQGQLRHENHIYSATTYYYLSPTAGTGKRVANAEAPSAWDRRTDRVTQRHFIDDDKTSLLRMGRLWFGDDFRFTPERTYTLPFADAAPGGEARLIVRAAARDNQSSTMPVSANGTSLGSVNFRSVSTLCYFCKYADLQTKTYELPATVSGDALSVKLSYSSTGTSNAWLDYVALEYERSARWRDQPLGFWLKGEASDAGAPVERVDFAQTRSGLWLWEGTDPTEVKAHGLTSDEGNAGFAVRLDRSRRFWLFDPAQASRPEPAGAVANQNLHGSPQVDYVIFTPKAWKAEADRLAEFHRNNYLNLRNEPRRVLVVTDEEVYHEFSSGTPDMTAYRNFLRMFYERAAGDSSQAPAYALLFADGSFDNREITIKGAHLPTYPARESLYPPEAFTSDDYIGFLDPSEGFWGEGTGYFDGDTRKDSYGMEVAVGRLPVSSVEEARAMVDKIIRYATDPASFGAWRNKALLVADFKINGESFESNHMREADGLDRDVISACSPCTQVDKLYMDSYPSVQMAEGLRYPSVTKELVDRVEQGRLVINYTGHGGTTGLSNSYIFEMQDIERLRNRDKLGFWVTATCDFGRYDDPEKRSGAEALVMNSEGGAIGLMTSVRQVFSDGNEALNRNFFSYLFGCTEASDMCLGTALREAKNKVWNNYPINTRNFTLLADPGLALVRPQYRAVITQVNGRASTEAPDTLRALSMARITGEIRDKNDNLIADANGLLDVNVFDKPQQMITQVAKYNYNWTRNRLFTGKASVSGGRFEFTFVVPLDISYEIGAGNIVVYAQTDWMDAAGCTRNVVICCTDSTAPACENRPSIALSINDRRWRDGGLTHANPLLIADVQDELGVNSTGTGVGRDLVAILNGNEKEPYVLTPYYEGNLDDHRRGTVAYRFENLPEGRHSVEFTAWNVCNLSAKQQVHFRVGAEDKVELADVKVYPNPARERVTFFFSHNLAGEDIVATVNIYDLRGRLVETLSSEFRTQSSLSSEMVWDLNAAPEATAAGLYVYSIRVESPSLGESSEHHGKVMVQP